MKEKINRIIEELNENNKETLENYKESGVIKYIEVLSASDACEVCKKWQGEKISLEVAINERILPIKECRNKKGYCRCCYLPVIEDA